MNRSVGIKKRAEGRCSFRFDAKNSEALSKIASDIPKKNMTQVVSFIAPLWDL